jgi:hypothetical protein
MDNRTDGAQARRFIWTLKCGRKEERLRLDVIATLLKFFDKVKPLLCSPMKNVVVASYCLAFAMKFFSNGKWGKLPKVLTKELTVRLKNKKAVNVEILGANFKREMPQREHPETTYSPDESEVDCPRRASTNYPL